MLHEEIFPISLNQYWLNFLDDSCAFTLKEFIEEHKKDFELHLDPWKEGPVAENPELPKIDTTELDAKSIKSRYVHGVVKVTGAPFVNRTRYYKT